MKTLKSQAMHYPQRLVIEPRMVDYNFDVTSEIVKEEDYEYEVFNYTTYRFANFTEYQDWVNSDMKEMTQTNTNDISDLQALIIDMVMGEDILQKGDITQ